MATATPEKLDDHYFLTPVETADFLGLTVEDLKRMRAAGTGPRFVAFTTRCTRYFASQLKEWKKENG